MKHCVNGLTQWKINQICNLGKTKTVTLITAQQNIRKNIIKVSYDGVNEHKYHVFRVTHVPSSTTHKVIMQCDPQIYICCIDSSMIWEIACSCNINHDKICVCEHACAVLLSLKDNDYDYEPLYGIADQNYKISPKSMIIGRFTCSSNHLPPCFPGPAYAFAVNHKAVLSWMRHKKASCAFITIFLYLGLIPEQQGWCKTHNKWMNLNFDRLQWICGKGHTKTVCSNML